MRTLNHFVCCLVMGLGCWSTAHAQHDTLLPPVVTGVHDGPDAVVEPTDTILPPLDVHPEFPGGMQALVRYLSSRIQYPRAEMEAGIEGKVLLDFVVTQDGAITDVVVKQGVDGGPGLAREAVRVVKGMPRWKPGMQGGKAVKTRYVLPVRFVMPAEEE